MGHTTVPYRRLGWSPRAAAATAAESGAGRRTPRVGAPRPLGQLGDGLYPPERRTGFGGL